MGRTSNSMLMNLLIVGNFAPDRQESMLRFERMLHTGMASRGHQVETLSPQPRFTRLVRQYRYGGFPKYLGYLDKFIVFPRQLRGRVTNGRTDIVHVVDQSNAVYARGFGRSAVLCTCHDLLQIRAALGELPMQRVSAAGRRFQGWILANMKRLPHAVCPSYKSREDLIRIAQLPVEKTSVIHNGLNFPYKPIAPTASGPIIKGIFERMDIPAKRRPTVDSGFWLNVGGAHWYKNRRGVLGIYGELGRLRPDLGPLVMVGEPLSPEDAAEADSLGVGSKIVTIRGIAETELQALYSAADGLLFPSWEEGFGWPIAEAQACGCLVITSNRPPMTEVGGDAAIFVDPSDPIAAARMIVSAWDDRKLLRQRGLERAREWAPERMFADYEGLYTRLAGTKDR